MSALVLALDFGQRSYNIAEKQQSLVGMYTKNKRRFFVPGSIDKSFSISAHANKEPIPFVQPYRDTDLSVPSALRTGASTYILLHGS
jgi:hypothetical protein